METPAPSTSSSFSDSLLQLKADADDLLAPLKALNDESPNKEKPQKLMEIEQPAYMKRLESFNKFVSLLFIIVILIVLNKFTFLAWKLVKFASSY